MNNLENKIEEKSFWSRAKNKTAAVLGAALLFAYGMEGCGGSKSYDCESACEGVLACCQKTASWGNRYACEGNDYENIYSGECVSACRVDWSQMDIKCFTDYCTWEGSASNPVVGYPPECEPTY